MQTPTKIFLGFAILLVIVGLTISGTVDYLSPPSTAHVTDERVVVSAVDVVAILEHEKHIRIYDGELCTHQS